MSSWCDAGVTSIAQGLPRGDTIRRLVFRFQMLPRLDIDDVAATRLDPGWFGACPLHYFERALNEFREQNQCLRFHHVVMSEVLEHVQNPEELLLLAWSLCRKTLWVTFPNIAYFPHRLRLLAGKFPVQWVVFPGEHLRFWSIPDFRHWLQQLHLPIATLSASNGITLLGLHRLWPNLLANQIVARIDKDSAA